MESHLIPIQEVQGLNPYLHSLFFYIQIYLFILLGFLLMSALRRNDRTGIRPDWESFRNPNCFKKLFRVDHSRTASKHFSHEHPFEQFKLDHLVLHTLKYEVMGFGSSYILQDPDLSIYVGYLIVLFFSSSQTSYPHSFIFVIFT